MSWDVETDGDHRAQLDWADAFVRERDEPLDLVLGSPFDKADTRTRALLERTPSRAGLGTGSSTATTANGMRSDGRS